MSNKLRHSATLIVSEADMLTILTEAVCDMFGAFSGLRVTAAYQAEGFQFVLEMGPKPAAKPQLAAVAAPTERATAR